MATAFIPDCPSVDIHNGVVTISAQSGDETVVQAMPLVTFRRLISKGNATLQQHDHAGTVVDFPTAKPTRGRRVKKP